MKLPKTLGACADMLYTLRAQRLLAEQVVKDAKANEDALRKHIIAQLPKSEATGVAGNIARATITRRNVPTVNDWDALHRHILETEEFDLLQRRVSTSAAAERWSHGVDIPGVERYVSLDVSVTKLGGG